VLVILVFQGRFAFFLETVEGTSDEPSDMTSTVQNDDSGTGETDAREPSPVPTVTADHEEVLNAS